MTKFIDVSNNDTKEERKETVFTHFLDNVNGWQKSNNILSDFYAVKYLGNCSIDGDMFAGYIDGDICIYKGTKGEEFNQ